MIKHFLRMHAIEANSPFSTVVFARELICIFVGLLFGNVGGPKGCI